MVENLWGSLCGLVDWYGEMGVDLCGLGRGLESRDEGLCDCVRENGNLGLGNEGASVYTC